MISIPYQMWQWMMGCCYDPTHKDYRFYGERGITVHEPWQRSFDAFARGLLSTIGPKPEGLQIGRIDKSQGFVPGNLAWVTSKENNNNRSSNKLIEFRGQSKTASEWADEMGLPRQQVANRINRGWDVEQALTAPLEDRTCLIEIDGEVLTITEWAEKTGRRRTTIRNRLDAGMTEKEAVFGELSRKFDGLCPRCRKEPRAEKDNYCRQCRCEYMAAYAAKKKARKDP